MAYNDSVKLAAYSLYLQSLSYEEIARRFSMEFALSTLKGGTVRQWAEKPDERGETWEDHRERVRAAMRKNVEETAVTRMEEIRSKSETIMESLYESLTSASAPKIKSFEGAVYAFKTISEFTLALESRGNEQMHPLLIVQAMMEVFQEIPEVRRAIKVNWTRIQEEIRTRLQDAREIRVIAHEE